MDPILLLAILAGLNTGAIVLVVVVLVVFFTKVAKPRPSTQAPTNVVSAMGLLCTLVSEHQPDWNQIQITRSGEGVAMLQVRSGDTSDDDASGSTKH